MAYATEVKVEALIAQFDISGSTALTSTQLAVIIEDVDGGLDSCLAAAGVVVPVIAPTYFLNWLEGVASAGATARVLKSMFPDATGPAETPAYSFWQKIYENALKMIKDGSIIPPDADLSGSVAPSTYFTRNPDVEEKTGGIAEPLFKIGDTL